MITSIKNLVKKIYDAETYEKRMLLGDGQEYVEELHDLIDNGRFFFGSIGMEALHESQKAVYNLGLLLGENPDLTFSTLVKALYYSKRCLIYAEIAGYWSPRGREIARKLETALKNAFPLNK